MKKYILAAAAALTLGMAAHAADSTGAQNRFYIDPSPVVIDPSTHMGAVNVYLENETADFNSFLIDFYLPEGFTIEKNSRGKYAYTLYNADDGKTYDHALSITPNSGNMYRFVGYSPSSEPIATGNGKMFSFNIVAPTDFTDSAEVDMANIQIAAGNTVNTVKKHLMEDQTFAVKAFSDVETGIDDLTTEEEPVQADEERAYDLQGRSVKAKNAERGIYIINGQKVIK